MPAMSRRTWLVLAAAGVSTACFYPADRGRQMETRVDKLSDDEKKLADDMQTQLQSLQKRSEDKVAEMNKALETLDRAEHRSDADVGIQLQKVVEDVAQLRGQVESYLFKINELEASLKKMSDDVDTRFTAVQGTEAVKAAEAKKKADELKRPADKKEFLALAADKAKGGDAPLARELYDEFLKKWPKDELVGDAHFGRGDTYVSEDKCREALSEFRKVMQDFPKSKSAPFAYLRSAECFKKLKMLPESKLAYEELLRSYPKSDAAKEAKQKLDGDKKKGPK
jgi:tol-pal system protein YbgF